MPSILQSLLLLPLLLATANCGAQNGPSALAAPAAATTQPVGIGQQPDASLTPAPHRLDAQTVRVAAAGEAAGGDSLAFTLGDALSRYWVAVAVGLIAVVLLLGLTSRAL
jgi:hypothetical protein